jgi:predicted esterase
MLVVGHVLGPTTPLAGRAPATYTPLVSWRFLGPLVLAAMACTPAQNGPEPSAAHAAAPKAATAQAPAPTAAPSTSADEHAETPETELAVPPPADSEPEVAIREVRVPGDASILVAQGETSTPIVYLHGRCGDPTAFRAWAQAGVKFGTILSLKGDQKCKGGGRTKWTEDGAKLDRRITRAIEVARTELGIELDTERRLVVGYSQGALRAELLGTKFPKRYPRAVLIAGPRAPRPTSLVRSEAVLLVVGDHDAREHLSEAATKLARAGRAVRYLELPGARHGEYGTAAPRVFSEGLTWLIETPTRLEGHSDGRDAQPQRAMP